MKTFLLCAFIKIGIHKLGFQPILIFLRLFLICVLSVFLFFCLPPAVYLLANYCFSASSTVYRREGRNGKQNQSIWQFNSSVKGVNGRDWMQCLQNLNYLLSLQVSKSYVGFSVKWNFREQLMINKHTVQVYRIQCKCFCFILTKSTSEMIFSMDISGLCT